MSRTLRPLAGLCGVSTLGIESSKRAQNWGSALSDRHNQQPTQHEKGPFLKSEKLGNDGPQEVEAERGLTVVLSGSILVSHLSCVQDEFNVDNHCDHQKQHRAGLLEQKKLVNLLTVRCE